MQKKYFLLIFFSCIQLSVIGQIHLILEKLPESTPKDAKIYMASSINGWKPNHAKFLFQKQEDGSYLLKLAHVKPPLEFKLTLGSWQTVELNAQNQEIANRRIEQVEDSIFVVVANWKDAKQKIRPKSTASENVKRLSQSFEITSLGRTRKVWIYLPPDYKSSQKHYPVLYMHDGQNVFDNITSYAGEWKVDELLNQYFQDSKKGFIVVAIENGNQFRLEEYQPWEHETYGKGKGKEYVDFLVNTIKPFVDENYRTLTEAAHTAIIGSSMGGLISLYASLQYPEVFGKAGVFSPAFWIAKSYLKTFIDEFKHSPKPKMYFLVGMLEGETMYPFAREIFEYLQEKEFKNITFVKKMEGRHTESFWSSEFLSLIDYLFPKYELYEQTNNINTFKIQSIPNNQKLFLENQKPKTKLTIIVKNKGKQLITQKWKSKTELNLEHFENGTYQVVLKQKKEIVYQANLIINN